MGISWSIRVLATKSLVITDLYVNNRGVTNVRYSSTRTHIVLIPLSTSPVQKMFNIQLKTTRMKRRSVFTPYDSIDLAEPQRCFSFSGPYVPSGVCAWSWPSFCATLVFMSLSDCSRFLPLGVSSVPWELVMSTDNSGASLLLSVDDVQASIYFVYHPDPDRSYVMLRVARGPALEASLQLRFMGYSSWDSFDEESFKGLEFLHEVSSDSLDVAAIEQGLRHHWLLYLAERVTEVMLCTGFSERRTTSVDVWAASSCPRTGMLRGVLSAIKPGHVGATAALIGGIVYLTPSSDSLEGLFDLTDYTGLRDMWMIGSLEHPCEEPVLFKNTDHVVISHLVSQDDSDKALGVLRSAFGSYDDWTTCFDGSSSWPLMWFTRSEWDVKATQRMIHSTTDSPELIEALLTSNSIVDSNHPRETQATDKYIKYAVKALTPLGGNSLDAVENVFRLTKSVDKHKWLAALMCASFTESLVVHLYGKNWRDSVTGSIKSFYEAPQSVGGSNMADSHREIAYGTKNSLHRIMMQMYLSDEDGLWSLLETTLSNALIVCSFLDRFQDTGLNASVVLNRTLRRKDKRVYSLGLTHSRRICHLILLINETLIQLVNEHVLVNAHENPSESDAWMSGNRVKITSAVLDLMKALDGNVQIQNTAQEIAC